MEEEELGKFYEEKQSLMETKLSQERRQHSRANSHRGTEHSNRVMTYQQFREYNTERPELKTNPFFGGRDNNSTRMNNTIQSTVKSNKKVNVFRKTNSAVNIHSKKQRQGYIYAVNAFSRYLAESEISDRSTSGETSQNEETSELRVDFVNPAEFAYTRPDYFQFAGSDAVPIKNWTKLYVGIVNELCSRNSKLLAMPDSTKLIFDNIMLLLKNGKF